MTNLQLLKTRLGFPTRPLLSKITAFWLGFTLLNVTVWAFVSAISLDVDAPWFLWAAVPTAIPLAAAWWLGATARPSRR